MSPLRLTMNQRRGTPGKVLYLFCLLFAGVTVFTLWLRQHRAEIEWHQYPTAIGDTRFYDADRPLGKDDETEPNLKFEGAPEGLYRLGRKAEKVDDERMLSAGEEAGGRFTVYRRWISAKEWKEAGQPPATEADRFYLKTADDKYLPFGRKKS